MAHFRELPEDEGGITCMVIDDKNVGSIFSGLVLLKLDYSVIGLNPTRGKSLPI